MGRKITAPAFDLPRQFLIAHLQSQLRPDRVTIKVAHQLDSQPMIAISQGVLQDDDRLVDMTDDNVGIAGVVQVAKSGAPAHVFGLKERTRFIGYVLETNLPRLIAGL